MPATAKAPASTERPAVAGPGKGSRMAMATRAMTTTPKPSTTSATPSTAARRPDQPPMKSPAPQLIADASPKTMTARPGPAGSAMDRPYGLGVRDVRDVGGGIVHVRWAQQLDDRVGGRVVPIGRGHVDHLEVLRDLAQELERAPGPL